MDEAIVSIEREIELIQVAKEAVHRAGHDWTAQMMGYGDDGQMFMTMAPYETEQEKDMAIEVGVLHNRSLGAKTLRIALDAWLSKNPDRYERASQDPERSEAMLLIDVAEDGTQTVWQMPYVTEGDEIVWDEPVKMERVQGRMHDLIDKAWKHDLMTPDQIARTFGAGVKRVIEGDEDD